MIRSAVEKIEQITKEKGFIYTFSFLVANSLFYDPEQVADIDWHSRLNFQELSFLAGIMLKNTINLDCILESDCQDQFERAHLAFRELHDAFMKPSMEHLQRALQSDQRESQEQFGQLGPVGDSGEAMAESVFYGDAGGYDFQFLDFAIKRYEQDNQWIRKHKGFNVQTAVSVYRELKNLHTRQHLAIRKSTDFNAFCKAALSIFCFSSQDLATCPVDEVQSILKSFSCVPGTVNEELRLPGEYNKFVSHPLIKLEADLYFVPVLFNLAQSIYESPFYWMGQDKDYRNVSLKNRGEITVDLSMELIATVFDAKNVYKQVVLEKKKGETLTDIDLLAVKGNKAVVFQIKSKKLTSLARIGNVENLRKDFHNAVQEAYDQAIKCRDAILNQTAKLINSGGNEIQVDDSINDVYIICLTTDHYPAIAYQARAFLTKKPGNPNPITISIFDLDVLAYYLKDPFEFLYYLRQRVQLYDSFMGQNEVELLAYHLNQKLYPRKDEEGRSINFVLTEGMAQLIDAHFPSVRGDQPATKAMERLHSKWNNAEFQEIIDQLKKSNQSGFTDAIFYLYDLSGRGADQFIAEIRI